MATIADTIQKFVTPDTSKQKEQYTFLLKAAQAKMAVYKAELDQMFLNPDALGKVQIVGNRALEYHEQYHVDLGSKSDIIEKIGTSVGNFIKGDTADITNGILNIASTAVDAILGNVSIGECEDKQFFVIPQHNAIIRIDTKCWRYNFSSQGIITDSENIFCYVCCKSVVDHTKLTDDEFTYLLSEYVGDDPDKVKAYAQKLREIWNALKDKKPDDVLNRVKAIKNEHALDELTVMNDTEAEEALKQLIDKISTLFYDGKPFTIFGGTCPVVSQITVEAGDIPNGNLAPMEQPSYDPYNPTPYGLAVTQGVLNIDNNTALKFVLGHELGHGFSEVLLTKIGLRGVSGFLTEVVADLGSAYLLSQTGSTWDDILDAVDKWSKYQIFDPNQSGDHPPGDKRAEYVHTLKTLIADNGQSFEDAVKGICESFPPNK
jgi:hypothetical protein